MCDYCESPRNYNITCETRLHGLMVCELHHHLALRDVRAWFRAEGLVRQQDFLKSFPEVANIKINVPRSQGSLTPDGNLSDEPYQFLQKAEGAWMARVLFTEPNGEIKNKYVKLRDFDKSEVPEETIEKWCSTLDDFYREEWEQNASAKNAGKEKIDPYIPGIAQVYSNGVVVGNAFMPRQMEML